MDGIKLVWCMYYIRNESGRDVLRNAWYFCLNKKKKFIKLKFSSKSLSINNLNNIITEIDIYLYLNYTIDIDK